MAVNPFSNGSSNMIVLTFEGDNMEVSGNDYDMSIGARKKIRVEGDTKEKDFDRRKSVATYHSDLQIAIVLLS